MPLKIVSITKPTGCDHIIVTVDHEGVSRTFTTHLGQIDSLIDDAGGPLLATRDLVLLWAAYRRARGRDVIFSASDISTEIA